MTLFAEPEAEGYVYPDAIFSPDGMYRYKLVRRNLQTHESKGTVAFILLNPSTADETHDDPTIRRCIRYAKDWGYGRLVVLNLFAFRATKPSDLKKAGNPWGPENGHTVHHAVIAADLVVAAWGAHGTFHNAGRLMLMKLRDWHIEAKVFGYTKDWQPLHPLYLRADAELAPF